MVKENRFTTPGKLPLSLVFITCSWNTINSFWEEERKHLKNAKETACRNDRLSRLKFISNCPHPPPLSWTLNCLPGLPTSNSSCKDNMFEIELLNIPSNAFLLQAFPSLQMTISTFQLFRPKHWKTSIPFFFLFPISNLSIL